MKHLRFCSNSTANVTLKDNYAVNNIQIQGITLVELVFPVHNISIGYSVFINYTFAEAGRVKVIKAIKVRCIQLYAWLKLSQ